MKTKIYIRRYRHRLISLSNGVVAVCAIGLAIADIEENIVSGSVWAILLFAYALLNIFSLRISAAIVLLAAVLLAVVAFVEFNASFAESFNKAGFFFAFLVVLKFFGRMASRSDDFVSGAQIIISRPPGIRYLFLTFGTHIFSLFINIGGVVLMMSMLEDRLRQADKNTISQSTLAVLRGFAATSAWSPLSLSMIVVLSLVEGVSYGDIAPAGLFIAIGYMLVGYVLDARQPTSLVEWKNCLSLQDLFTFLCIVLRIVSLILVIFLMMWIFNFSLLESVFLSMLVGGGLWSGLQKFFASGELSVVNDVCNSSSTIVNEVSIIVGAVFIGSVASNILATWHGLSGILPLPAAVAITAVIPSLVVLAAMFAVNPLVTVSVLAGIVAPAWPTESKSWLVLAFLWGWSLSASGTPFTANVLMAAQAISRRSTEIAIKWNGKLTYIGVIAAGVVCSSATYLTIVNHSR